MLTRFAPSPTGYLHLGNMRTALLCYLYAKKSGGKFMLRIDDTDAERSREEYIEAIKEDLTWMGISWDVFSRQSQRLAAYDAALGKLKSVGLVYACYETQSELEIKRKMQLSRGLPPIYDREGLNLSQEKKAKYEAEGRKPHWRFRIQDKKIAWDDKIRGRIEFEGKNIGDPILVRENGEYTYMFPSTVDDVDFAVTHVLRGEDHISNTAVQIQIFEALGKPAPLFAHNALIKTKEGKLSKRKGSGSIREMRDVGMEQIAIASFLAKVGTSDPIDLKENLQILINEFDIKKFGRAATIYEEEDITRLNTKFLHQAPFSTVRSKLQSMGIDIDEDSWLAIRPNIENLSDAKTWWDICNKPVICDNKDKEFLATALAHFPDGEVTDATWGNWTDSIKQATGRKGKELYMPLRQALTGMDHGPELKALLPLLGRDKITTRLGYEVS